MRNPIITLIVSILLINASFCSSASGQREFGFKMPNKTKQIQIPFEMHNNLIVIPITINEFLTLKFIVDTGVETAILTEKLYADLLNLNYLREIIIAGPGIVDSIAATVANDITFSLPGGIFGENMNLLVLKEDYLKLSENIGENVHGIIGYDIFSRFVVNIDYDEQVLTLTKPSSFKKPRRAAELSIGIVNRKPFLNATITQSDKKASLNMMVDTGASHAALIDYSQINNIPLPQKKIETQLGRGIAGEIPGYIGRMDSLEIDDFEFNDMLVSAPFEGAYNKTIKRGARIGTFGGELLHRFNVTFDYSKNKMYLKKSASYGKAFEFDMSGLSLNSIGDNLDTMKVVDVKEGSPAYKAGIREGDVILSMNNKNLRNNTLSEIYTLLQKKDKMKIRCKILRDNEKIKTKFRLARMI
ncbi:MAG: aspartyl protease family protein [Ekhidna sp.]